MSLSDEPLKFKLLERVAFGMEIKKQPPPIACTLGPGEFAGRLAWIAKLTSESLQSHERDGLTLELRFAPGAVERVRELVRREQACCAFLTFELHEEPDHVRLVVTAPEEARAAVDTIYGSFTAARGKAARSRGILAAMAIAILCGILCLLQILA